MLKTKHLRCELYSAALSDVMGEIGLMEQELRRSCVPNHALVMRKGRIVREIPSAELSRNELVLALGTA